MKRLDWLIERDVLRAIAKVRPAVFKDKVGFHYDEVYKELLFTYLNMTTGNEWTVSYTRSDAESRGVWRQFFTPDGEHWMLTVSFGHDLLNYPCHEKFKQYLLDVQALRQEAKKSFRARVKYWLFTGWWVK